MGYIKSGKESGATTLMGGERHGSEGYFIQPTVFTNADPESKIMREEIFGPVVCVCKFQDEEDLIKSANDTVYGLVSSFFNKLHMHILTIRSRLLQSFRRTLIEP